MTTQISDIHDVVTAVLAERGLDRRLCYVDVRPEPPAGKRIIVESSDPEVVATLETRLSEADLDVSCVPLPVAGADLPECLVTASSVADVRREAAHTSELVTQLIDGDVVTPLKAVGDWFLVQLDDGYVGWVRSWHVEPATRAEVDRFSRAAHHRILDNVVQIFTEADESALPLCDAVVGTRLVARACGRRGWRRVRLANGREGFARGRCIERIPRAGRVSRDNLVATGMRFLGIPYLWGGNTPKGFDCSGLVQRIFQLQGVRLPRDSDLQARVGREKPAGRPGELETADLLFFGKHADRISHVGLYLSNGLFLHAYGQVKVGSVDPRHPLFEPKLVADWQTTRDALSL